MSSNTTGLIYCLSGWVRNQRWRPGTESAYEITCSAAMLDSNQIPTAIPMFLRSIDWCFKGTSTQKGQFVPTAGEGNRQHDCTCANTVHVRVSGISKMAAYNRKWIYATNLAHTLRCWSIQISTVMMLDKNISSLHPMEFRCYHIHKMRFMLFHIHFRLQVAIFDILPWRRICTRPTAFLGLKNGDFTLKFADISFVLRDLTSQIQQSQTRPSDILLSN